MLQIFEIEQEINAGQIEQLIEQAKSELRLIPLYASWKAWEDKVPETNNEINAVREGAQWANGVLRNRMFNVLTLSSPHTPPLVPL